MTSLLLISGFLLAFGLYMVIQKIFGLPSRKAVEAIRNIHGRQEFSKKLQDTLQPLARLLSNTVQANTLYRYEMGTGEYVRVSGISDNLAETLRENGADNETIAHLREVTE